MKKQINYDKLLKKYEKEAMISLTNLVAINSQYDESTVNDINPFSFGVSKALDYVARMAKRDGFKVVNHANKVVEILCGEGDKNITIMAHADVVPEGNNWIHEPFQLSEDKDGILYGRGVADDKGPLLAAYYALKALKDKKLLGNYQVRFLVGGNEERGSACMQYYFNTLKKKAPTYGFSPDSDFPLIFAEKCINAFIVKKELHIPGLISLKGGLVRNAVIDKCVVSYSLSSGNFINFILENYSRDEAEIHTEDDIVNVIFHGKSAHGSSPKDGINAGLIALNALYKFSKNKDLKSLIDHFSTLDGSGFDGLYQVDGLGDSTSNVGLIDWDNKTITLTVDYRHFSSDSQEKIQNKIKTALNDYNVEFMEPSLMLYYPLDSILVSSLLKAYQEETGDYESRPIAIGGGTYSKLTSNVVAYGLTFPGRTTNIHAAEEHLLKADYFKAMRIYARAIIELGKHIDED